MFGGVGPKIDPVCWMKEARNSLTRRTTSTLDNFLLTDWIQKDRNAKLDAFHDFAKGGLANEDDNVLEVLTLPFLAAFLCLPKGRESLKSWQQLFLTAPTQNFDTKEF